MGPGERRALHLHERGCILGPVLPPEASFLGEIHVTISSSTNGAEENSLRMGLAEGEDRVVELGVARLERNRRNRLTIHRRYRSLSI